MKIEAARRLALVAGVWITLCCSAQAQIYKVVDEHGNVTYTDQAPADGTAPMELPDLPVVQTAPIEPLPDPVPANGEDATAEQEPTPRELRRMYQDFRITRPAPEETFWGTENTVVVSWTSSNAIRPEMSVRLLVDGQPERDTQQGMVALTLDRGEHTVQAELRDGRGRRVVMTEPVTFYVKQHSRLFNQPGPAVNDGP